MPARERSMASHTRLTACPDPLRACAVSRQGAAALSLSPSIRRETGMPVHRATMRAISSPRPQCFRKACFPLRLLRLAGGQLLCSLGSLPYLSSAALLRSYSFFRLFQWRRLPARSPSAAAAPFSISCFSFASFACMPRKVSRSSEAAL